MTISVLALTSLHISEKMNWSMSATKDVEKIYQEDSIVEMTIHVLRQMLATKVLTETENQEMFLAEDWSLVEDTLHNDVFPYYSVKDTNVYVEAVYLPPTVDYFCQTIYDESTLNVQGYACLKEAFDVQVSIQVKQKNQLKRYLLDIGNLYAVVSPDGQSIMIDSTNAIYRLSKE